MSKLVLNPEEVRTSIGSSAGSDGGPAPPRRLNQSPHWNDRLQRLRSHIIQGDERGLPRYGVLSILARRVPFHLYDHPALVRLCNTAFTDGIHVFVHTAFLAEVIAQDAQGNGGERRHSMVLILLHELSHILFRHHGRLPPNAPPLLWAIACDISINARLLTAYPELRPGQVFDDAWGTQPDEVDRYLGHSEEHILHGLWEDPGPGAAALVRELKETLGAGHGRVKDGRGLPQDVHGHLVSPEHLARTLDENGLEHVRETLTLPDPNDKPAYQNLAAMTALYLTADLDRARELRERHPAGRTMAGGHLEEASAEWVSNRLSGRVEWKTLLRELVLGNGVRYDHCDEVPNDVFYVDPDLMGLDAPIYIGSLTPASPDGVVLCVLDSSGSVSVELLEVFIGELNSLIEHDSVRPDQVYIVSADTAIRADIESFSSHELACEPERLRLHGRGGTDITRVINEVLQWAEGQSEFARHECKALIYFTDLLDRAPVRDALPPELPAVLFLTPPTPVAASFRAHVAPFASVAEIRDGTVIDLCPS
ncbi:MAG: VWA-like domain-containing protein [Pseudomonadota bacterium]